jgi:hypothetical protein
MHSYQSCQFRLSPVSKECQSCEEEDTSSIERECCVLVLNLVSSTPSSQVSKECHTISRKSVKRSLSFFFKCDLVSVGLFCSLLDLFLGLF